MNENVRGTAKLILSEIVSLKQGVKGNDSHGLLISLETLMAALASLTGPLVDLEMAYRNKLKEHILTPEVDGKSMSQSKAEVLAKAGDEYKDWQKILKVYELAQEQVLVIKKFSDKIEYGR